ncbi:s-adenosyl-l-methionine-dependent methyltransferase [Lucifera butyrica]|uniref:Ribosomal protein L11 methyltransferase n=1 Tax=Lucifera butyrica TaxID=1351585 RepID=A0A498R0P4_9FIRM|nr:50S ribosomal protein L11 methyltransferase [Lucifera butyrica]VBB06096.1 s-adenosyl-l-methionine-dependent methyltransferase [Lucifera butyrica]
MKWAEITIQTSHEATEAVANIFHDLGASGVVIEDPELINSYKRSGTWEYCDLPDESDTDVVTVKAYLPVDDLLDDKLKRFEQRVDELASHNLDKGRGDINWREVKEEDWATAWKDYFHPALVGDRIVIKPSWEDYQPGEKEIVIELDPGMAFGTGTHHTTQLCIRSLEEYVKPGDVVFDVGTGSGILAIAAAKLGANEVYAVDFDALAVTVANENILKNAAQDVVTVAQGDLLSKVDGKADLIVANIIADIIIKMLNEVPLRLKPGGIFIASGIIAERVSDVTAAMLTLHLDIEKVMEQGGWAAIVARQGGV